MLHPSNGPTLLNLCVCLAQTKGKPQSKSWLRKSLIFGGNIGLEVEEVGKVESVQPTDIQFAVKVRKSTIRELQSSRRELLGQLAHKTYERLRRKLKNEVRR